MVSVSKNFSGRWFANSWDLFLVTSIKTSPYIRVLFFHFWGQRIPENPISSALTCTIETVLPQKHKNTQIILQISGQLLHCHSHSSTVLIQESVHVCFVESTWLRFWQLWYMKYLSYLIKRFVSGVVWKEKHRWTGADCEGLSPRGIFVLISFVYHLYCRW